MKDSGNKPPRLVALAGAVWQVGDKTCRIPVEDKDDPSKGEWVEVPLVRCAVCRQVAPTSPCPDCEVTDIHLYPERECDICGGPYRDRANILTCSQSCSTLKANTHNANFQYRKFKNPD
jgi:hypothetical protein